MFYDWDGLGDPIVKIVDDVVDMDLEGRSEVAVVEEHQINEGLELNAVKAGIRHHKRWEQLTNNLSPARRFSHYGQGAPKDRFSLQGEEEEEDPISFKTLDGLNNNQAKHHHFNPKAKREQLPNLSPAPIPHHYGTDNAKYGFSLPSTENDMSSSFTTNTNKPSDLYNVNIKREELPNLTPLLRGHRRNSFRTPTSSEHPEHRNNETTESLNQDALQLYRGQKAIDAEAEYSSPTPQTTLGIGKGDRFLTPALTGGIGSGVVFLLVTLVLGLWYYRSSARKRRGWWKKMGWGESGLSGTSVVITGSGRSGEEWDEDARAVVLSDFGVERGLGRYRDLEAEEVV